MRAALRADRPRGLHRRARQHVPLRDRARRARARGRRAAAGRAGLRRPRDVGEDRPQPALERVQVHLRGRDRGPLRRDGADAVLTVADTGAGIAADELASLFERFHRVAACARAPTRAPASGSRWCGSWSACTAARAARESELGGGHDVHGHASRSGTRTCRPARPSPTTRRRRRTLEEALRWLPDADASVGELAADGRGRLPAGAGPPPAAGGSCSPTTTPTCAITSRGCSPALGRRRGGATAAPP